MINRFVHRIFQRLWLDYRGKVDQVGIVEDAIRDLGENWVEDHVAFRTLPGPNTGAHVLQQLFECLGYTRKDSYEFEDKKLSAFWMEPPGVAESAADTCPPKIFISEIEPKSFSLQFQSILAKLTARVEATPLVSLKELQLLAKHEDTDDDTPATDQMEECIVHYLTGGPCWGQITLADYETLRRESEYAAWTAAFGPAANHFTVSVFLMSKFRSLAEFNDYCLENLDIEMNVSGGAIKGSPELKLQQSSTLACPVPYLFQDGVKMLPYAFIEFAYRHPLEGKSKTSAKYHDFYQGFVVKNADKIFESTNIRN